MAWPAAAQASATPSVSSARSALPGWMMPTPSGECSSLTSTISAAMPRFASAIPSESPPMPPPTTRTDFTAAMSGKSLVEKLQAREEQQHGGDAKEHLVRHAVLQPDAEWNAD